MHHLWHSGSEETAGIARRSIRLFPLVVLLGMLAAGAASADDCASMCSGLGDCTISGTHYLGNRCVLGSVLKNVTINSGAVLYVDGADPFITVFAANLALAGTLRARQGTVNVFTGGFTTSGSGTIDVHSLAAGGWGTIYVQAGDCELGGAAWNANGSGSPYGNISLYCASVTGTSALNANGAYVGDDITSIDIEASSGNVDLTGTISADGKGDGSVGGNGGLINIWSASGQVSLSAVSADGSGAAGGGGGAIFLSAGTALTLSGDVTATSTGGVEGGYIELWSGGPVTIKNAVNASQTGSVAVSNGGGSIRIRGNSVTSSGAVSANGVKAGSGGYIEIQTNQTGSGTITVTQGGTLKANGGTPTCGSVSSNGGTIYLGSEGDITLAGDASVTAACDTSVAGDIIVSSNGTLTVTSASSLTANTTSGNGEDGSINLCGNSVIVGGQLNSHSTSYDPGGGQNAVKYLEEFTGQPGSSMKADADDGGQNWLYCPCVLNGETCASPATCASAVPVIHTSLTPAGTLVPTPIQFDSCY